MFVSKSEGAEEQKTTFNIILQKIQDIFKLTTTIMHSIKLQCIILFFIYLEWTI